MSIERPESFETDHLTDEQKANLDKLASYLESLPADYEKFSMQFFYMINKVTNYHYSDENLSLEKPLREVYTTPQEDRYPCNSAACAIGHGPAAGIEIEDGDVSWSSYAKRAFGYHEYMGATEKYIFGPGAREDGSERDPHAAAARIREVLAAAEG